MSVRYRSMSITNYAPSSVAQFIVPDTSRPVAVVAISLFVAIIIAAALATGMGVMDIPAVMEDLFPPVTTPPPFAPSAS